jgi:hypothetical protein
MSRSYTSSSSVTCSGTALPLLSLIILYPFSPELSRVAQYCGAGRPVDGGLIPGRGERILPVTFLSRPALGPTQPPVQRGAGSFTPGQSAAGAWL